jgi:hypothetical protein
MMNPVPGGQLIKDPDPTWHFVVIEKEICEIEIGIKELYL